MINTIIFSILKGKWNKSAFLCSVFKMSTMETLQFDNRALRKLPIDLVARNYVRTVNAACFSKVQPTPVENPALVAFSSPALSLLGLSKSEFARSEFVDYFSGNQILPGSDPAAHCYCGHQFGNFAGQLGDGAAIYLGEVINSKSERWEIQLKGAGPTPYSRTADGRKVLRSSIREFLCSEAMHFLGVPTTRAGTCITSDWKVVRDMFYDGHPKEEKCTIVSRIAPTFIRFGSFEIFKTLDPTTGRVGPSVGRVEILHTLLNYVIETFYPEIFKDSDDPVQRYADFFKEIILRTARLVAQWQCIGFCHGVLNTDNMSIVGLTLDYGPFGFLDMFDPNHICNATDEGGRYSFTKQPEICLWNLKKLSEVIQQALPLNISSPLLDLFQPEFQTTFLKKMRAKLGLIATEPHDDMCLIQELFDTMEKTGADFTNTFLCLLHMSSDALDRSLSETSEKLVGNCYPLQLLISTHKPSVEDSQIQVFKAIAASNPEIVEKIGRAGVPINRVLLQLQKAESLMGLTQESKTEQDVRLWNTWLEKYKSRLLEDIKCYKGDAYDEERNSVMKSNNPRFILRNYLLQGAIEKAEMGDYSEVQKLMEVLQNPYDHSYSEVVSLRDTQTANQGTHTGPSGSCSSYANNLDYPPREAFSLRVS